MNASARDAILRLYSVSILKQAKVREITSALGETRGQACLDIGGDNGVVSLLLRERGGTWHSADLDARAVRAIQEAVGDNVYQIDGLSTPFADASLDRVVIVDFLEHVHTDREFVRELARVLKPDGKLVVNVPHLKPRSVINRVRHAAGLTDEKHGHVRPGYTLEGLRGVLAPHFEIVGSRTYSRSFSEAIDAAMAIAYEWLGRRKGGRIGSAKGTVITSADVQGEAASFRLLQFGYPILRGVAALDRLLFFQPGYKLIVQARPARKVAQ